MAGRGPAPKDPATRRRTNPVRTTKIAPDGGIHGPELPEGVEFRTGADSEPVGWHSRTRVWWENWRRCDQASSLQPIEWDFLLDTARLHTELWLGDSSKAGEIRLRVAKFGATMEDRLRLRLEAVEPDTAKTVAKKTRNPTDRREAALRLVTGEETG